MAISPLTYTSPVLEKQFARTTIIAVNRRLIRQVLFLSKTVCRPKQPHPNQKKKKANQWLPPNKAIKSTYTHIQTSLGLRFFFRKSLNARYVPIARSTEILTSKSQALPGLSAVCEGRTRKDVWNRAWPVAETRYMPYRKEPQVKALFEPHVTVLQAIVEPR